MSQVIFVTESFSGFIPPHVLDTLGITATSQLLKNRFWWNTLQTDTITYIKNIQIGATAKSFKQLPAGLLQPLPISQRPWSHIAIDFSNWSFFQSLIPLSKLPTAFETDTCLIPVPIHTSVLWSIKRHCFRPRPAVYLRGLEGLLSPAQCQRKLFFWLQSTD